MNTAQAFEPFISFWGQRGLAAAGDSDAQRADRAETSGPAGRVTRGAAQTAAVSIFQYGGPAGASSAAHDSAVGQQCNQVDGISGRAAPAPVAGVAFLIDGFAELFWAGLRQSRARND